MDKEGFFILTTSLQCAYIDIENLAFEKVRLADTCATLETLQVMSKSTPRQYDKMPVNRMLYE